MPRLLLLLLLVAAPALAAPAAGPVLVVRSQDLGPYLAAEDAFARAWGGPVERLALSAGDAALERALAQKPQAVVALGQEAARTVLALKPRVPVVCALVPFPEWLGQGVVAVPMFASPAAQLRALKGAVPRLERVGVVYDPARTAALVASWEKAARAAGLSLEREEVKDLAGLAPAVRALAPRVQALWLVPDPALLRPDSFKFLVQTSLERKLPLLATSQAMARAGALLALESDWAEAGQLASSALRRLVAGDRDVAAGAPRGALYLNARTAEAIGVSVPEALRREAAGVFE